ncbi:hypothetical protein [Nocardiopsis lambiniae]|uniref:FCD domain-containing protein n=1 Tax=Nocardiopsis lambiniae TaxID=3075539 RepID=A0ABU2M960_9ACTN|nr:hypothetical protein [Nocardiopsis sp. DSM 44743]MDT0329213.1 hypothetical protein [Nocardiopsis sp. DSM 44743]
MLWTREPIEDHRELVAVLRRESAVAETREGALLRARVEEALALVEDPETAARFARHLGDCIAHIPPGPPVNEACDPHLVVRDG